MSVNDDLNDDEWGNWGKNESSVNNVQVDSNDNKKSGFESDDEIAFKTNSTKSMKSFNTYKQEGIGGTTQDTSNKSYGGNKFSSNKDDNDKKYGRNFNNGDNNFIKKTYDEPKWNGNDDRNANFSCGKRDDSRENRNSFSNLGKNKENHREISRNGLKSYHNNDRNQNYKTDEKREFKNERFNEKNQEERRQNNKETKLIGYNDRSSKYDRDDSRENRNNGRKRDDSRENRYNGRKRDDSRENKYNGRKREDSRENKYNGRKRDDSRENKYNGRKREDSEENKYNGRKRDDSRENKYNGRQRDDSRENKYNGRQRDDSRENKYNGRQRDDSKEQKYNGRHRDDSRENKGCYGNEKDFKSKIGETNQRSQDYCNMADKFDRKINIDEDGPKVEETALPKRVTFIPNDDQAEYELHVNSGINFDNYDKIPVEVTGEDAPTPLSSFNNLNLPPFLQENITSLKYTKLTPVQKYAIPIIDKKRDLMGCAQTGSGKTAAFLIPIITALNANKVETPSSQVAFPKALIMAPTRELCRQIFTAARQLCRGSNVKCTYIYGGIEMNKSRRNIQEMGCDILVATPGRLIHFLELVWISLKYLQYFVLDEADRMLESEGFNESVNKIYKEANCSGEDRTIQISMFSATFPNEIQDLARNLLQNYLFLAVGVVGSANTDVKQEIILADQREKINTAIEFIKTISEQKTLIFVESKRMADFFGIKLGYLGFTATTIHGDREQEQREIALNDFKSGRVNFMVATNVAARGLDIPLVDNVINIDLPSEIDTYVHRIGRTGRCGNVGRAISFFDETKDIGLANPLLTKLQEANQECPDWLKALCDNCALVPTRRNNYSRDTRKDVTVNKFLDQPNDGFMKGTNVDYEDDVKATNSEWLDD